MKIGFVGVGKLGFPCALAMALEHDVVGFDVSDEPYKWLAERKYPYPEKHVDKYLAETSLRLTRDLNELVAHAEIIFCAVQTPHGLEYEGVTRMPATRADFDYSHLCEAVARIAEASTVAGGERILVVISTVLPGTCERELTPLLAGSNLHFAYNPYFIAMGTVIEDFLDPEFVLCGCEDAETIEEIKRFYGSIISGFVFDMSVKSAELTKVIYNTFITTKVTLANTVMELCERNGGDADDVMHAIGSAHIRLFGLAPQYIKPGMGDGGGCHPRDNIALSWLSKKLGMRYDPWGDLMLARERQTDWLADLIAEESATSGLPIVLLGAAFKAETNIMTGSAAVLLRNMLEESGLAVTVLDPLVDSSAWPPVLVPAVFFVAAEHMAFRELELPFGSVVLDPWGNAQERVGVRTRRIGREPRL